MISIYKQEKSHISWGWYIFYRTPLFQNQLEVNFYDDKKQAGGIVLRSMEFK